MCRGSHVAATSVGGTRVNSSGQGACVTPTATHTHRLEQSCAANMHALIPVDDVQRVACGCDFCWGHTSELEWSGSMCHPYSHTHAPTGAELCSEHARLDTRRRCAVGRTWLRRLLGAHGWAPRSEYTRGRTWWFDKVLQRPVMGPFTFKWVLKCNRKRILLRDTNRSTWRLTPIFQSPRMSVWREWRPLRMCRLLQYMLYSTRRVQICGRRSSARIAACSRLRRR
jgi:hypothetical protein